MGEWMVSCIGEECLESYKASKFGIWRRNMMDAFGGCAAAFLPELRRGHALSHVYDHVIFPSSLLEREAWEVLHNGKKVSIPRPVAALRLWRPSPSPSPSPLQAQVEREGEMEVEVEVGSGGSGRGGGRYEEISAWMPGAPVESEREQYWQVLLGDLREALNSKYGEAFVDDCLLLEVETVKHKYGF